MDKMRIRIAELYSRSQEELAQLEQKYIWYKPDYGEFTFKNTGFSQLDVHTQSSLVGFGYHLVKVSGKFYLISHSATLFNNSLRGYQGWEYYIIEGANYLKACYSNKTLGTRGTYFTAEQYEELSSWIKSIMGDNIFLGSKREVNGNYEVAVTDRSGKTSYKYLANKEEHQNYYPYVSCFFHPVIELSDEMYLVTDSEHDGSFLKEILLEPADVYDPATFELQPHDDDINRDKMIKEALGIMSSIKNEMKKLEEKFREFESIVSSLK